MATFADRMKELRKERGLKQADLCELLDMKLRGYQVYEYGEGYPEVSRLLILADFYNVSLDYLMGRTDKREVNR